MLVKAQIIRATTATATATAPRRAVMTNKNRTLVFRTTDPGHVSYLEKALSYDTKGFFRASVMNRNIKLLARVTNRKW